MKNHTRTSNESLRIKYFFLFLLLSYFSIAVRLIYLQILNADFFIQLGNTQYLTHVLEQSERGIIIDRKGAPLVYNCESHAAVLYPQRVKNKDSINAFLQSFAPAAHERLQQHPESQFIFLKRNLSQKEQEYIETLNLEGIAIIPEHARFYACPEAASIVGITDQDNNGISGIELSHNKFLSGKASIKIGHKDARKRQLELNHTAHNSLQEKIQLTIDKELQIAATQELQKCAEQFNAKKGSVLIMDPETGEILVVAQYPPIDPHNRTTLDATQLNPYAITDCYELGSVMKVWTMLAALAENKVTLDEYIDCHNKKETVLNGYRFTTWKAHDKLTVSEILSYSNNVGTAQIALRLGTDLYKHLQKLGFSSTTGLNWPGEPRGTITAPRNWSRGTLITLSFGYEINATLLQLARAFSIFANGGKLITPSLIKTDRQKLHELDILYNEEIINKMRGLLQATVHEGTARKAAIKGYTVLGKTGSALEIVDGTYDILQSTYTFAGIIEKAGYKRVVVASLNGVRRQQKTPLYAATVVVPLVEKIFHLLLLHEHIATDATVTQ